MKRIMVGGLAVMLLAGISSAQSLGDVARKSRAQKKPAAARVFTNDDLRDVPNFNNGAATGTAAANQGPAGPETEQKGAVEASPEDKAKLVADWKARFDEQKKNITLLERELDVTQREYKQQVALFYADGGNRLRNDRAWADQSRKLEADIATKQKDLTAARQKLEDMKEEARKAGMPSSVSD